MLKTPGLISSFAQGFNIPQQFFRERQQEKLGEVQRKQAQQNLIKSHILNQYLPRKMEEAQQQAQQAHILGQQAIQKGKDIASTIGPTAQAKLKQMQLASQLTQKKIESPYGTATPTGVVGQSIFLDRLKSQVGENDPRYVHAKAAFDAQQMKQQQIGTWRQKQMQSTAFKSLPSADKSKSIALAQGMGFDPTEAATKLTSGNTLQDMAKEKGLNLEQVKASYNPGRSLTDQAIQRSGYFKEIQSLEKNISEPTAKYGRRFFNFSPAQVADAIKNENPDTQGRFLAARGMQSELANLRTKVAQGKAGIEAVRDMKKMALANSRIFGAAVSPDARRAMNKYFNKWLGEAVNTYTKYVTQAGAFQKKPQLKTKQQSSQKDPLGIL